MWLKISGFLLEQTIKKAVKLPLKERKEVQQTYTTTSTSWFHSTLSTKVLNSTK